MIFYNVEDVVVVVAAAVAAISVAVTASISVAAIAPCLLLYHILDPFSSGLLL